MFKSLQMKLILIFFILISSVMSVLGTFMLNSVTTSYFEDFNKQITSVFTTDVISHMESVALNEDLQELKSIIDAYAGPLGIDSDREYYLIDGNSTKPIFSSRSEIPKDIIITANISSALNNEVGFVNSISSDYLDVAIPINNASYIVYILDNKAEINDLTWTLFGITLQAMFLGLIVSIILSFVLSKTMTNSIENLTKGAILRSEGDFSKPLEIQSQDEIGILTDTFNKMSDTLKETLDQVQEEKDKLSTLFLHMTDGVLAFNQDGSIINMNRKAEEIVGMKFREGLKFKDIFKDIKIPEYKNEKKDAKSVEHVETCYERDEKTFRVLFAPFGNMEDSDFGIMVVIYDITDSKRLEDARREFVANVSHELRTPLTNIKSYTETIMNNGEELDSPTEQKFLGIIAGETDRMTRVVKDLLSLSKLDHGNIEMNFERVDLAKILDKVYNAMLLVANNSNITLEKEIIRPLGMINGDSDRIEQVLTNIVSNAMKYNQSDGVVIIRAINKTQSTIEIAVIDTGFGIPDEDIPRLFERFYRVDKARSREKGGTGLGLAIAKNIIEVHNGTISINSVLERGTTVIITLPIAKDE
ncbi:MAG: ATP-binding protein [Clostridia bacterium]